MFGPRRKERGLEAASKKFWEEIQNQFPEIKLEDLDDGLVVALQLQMQTVLDRVLENTINRMEAEEEQPKATYYRRPPERR